MSELARVHSIEAIRTFRDQLAAFIEDARHALDATDMEIRRSTNWLSQDMFQYWRGEIKRRNQEVSSARVALHRKQMMKASAATAYDTDEKEAVQKATRRLREAEIKADLVKRWIPNWQHAVSEYQGHGRPMGDTLAGDLQKAMILLQRMTEALDAYVATAPPSVPRSAPVETPKESSL